MVEKISLHLTIKSFANDEKMILEATKKSSVSETKKTKEEEEVFNQLIEQRVNEEKNRANLKKKIKKQDDISNLFIPIYIQQTPNIQEDYLIKLKNSKRKKCSKCGELYEPNSRNNLKNDISVCESCLNKDIESFLRENYL
ncbi:MAG: hypothetical protein U0354_01630 [Candidatus Sericytochromatia bacterium]